MIRAVAVLTLAALPIGAQTTEVRGVTYDSLRGVPLVGALVTIEGTSLSAVSDGRGEFVFPDVPRGQHRLVMQHDVLDSIGYGGIARRVDIGDAPVSLVFGAPSFGTIWSSFCRGHSVPRDSGLVYGFIRLATTGRLLDSAVVAVAWREVSYASATGFDERQWGGSIASDRNGAYAICGVPADVGVRLMAVKDSLASDRIDVPASPRRVTRRDLTLGPSAESAIGSSLRGVISGAIAGDDGQPVPGAVIMSAGVADTRSGEDGRFVLRDVPIGTRQVEVRAIGAEPITAAVDVRPTDTAFVTVALRKVVTLPEVQVTGRTVRQALARGIEERKQVGLGRFRDSTEIALLPDPAAIFDGIAGLRVTRGPAHRFSIRHGSCTLSVFIDRVKLEPIDLALLRNEDIAAVEIYPDKVPLEFAGRGICGATVVWTKRLLDQNWKP